MEKHKPENYEPAGLPSADSEGYEDLSSAEYEPWQKELLQLLTEGEKGKVDFDAVLEILRRERPDEVKLSGPKIREPLVRGLWSFLYQGLAEKGSATRKLVDEFIDLAHLPMDKVVEVSSDPDTWGYDGM